jgi:hypothetical protein
MDQFAPPEMMRRLLELCSRLPDVRSRKSRFATSEGHALLLPDSEAFGPLDAFIDYPEFCHLHPPPETSIHLTLPPTAIDTVTGLGWAIRHPIHQLGVLKTLVLVYAPRDLRELDVVFSLVEHSCRFAAGALAGGAGMAAQRFV